MADNSFFDLIEHARSRHIPVDVSVFRPSGAAEVLAHRTEREERLANLAGFIVDRLAEEGIDPNFRVVRPHQNNWGLRQKLLGRNLEDRTLVSGWSLDLRDHDRANQEIEDAQASGAVHKGKFLPVSRVADVVLTTGGRLVSYDEYRESSKDGAEARLTQPGHAEASEMEGPYIPPDERVFSNSIRTVEGLDLYERFAHLELALGEFAARHGLM